MKKARRILDKYISNEIELLRGKKLLEIRKEELYTSTMPQYHNELGYIEYRSHRVEQAVTDIIQLEELFEDNYIDHYKTKALLDETLSVLNSKELEIFNHIARGKLVGNCEQQIQEQGKEVFNKLNRYIKDNHYTILNVLGGEIVWYSKRKELVIA